MKYPEVTKIVGAIGEKPELPDHPRPDSEYVLLLYETRLYADPQDDIPDIDETDRDKVVAQGKTFQEFYKELSTYMAHERLSMEDIFDNGEGEGHTVSVLLSRVGEVQECTLPTKNDFSEQEMKRLFRLQFATGKTY